MTSDQEQQVIHTVNRLLELQIDTWGKLHPDAIAIIDGCAYNFAGLVTDKIRRLGYGPFASLLEAHRFK